MKCLTTLLRSILLSGVLFCLSGCQTDDVPPIQEATYAGKLSDEPVLVQTITLDGVSREDAENAIIEAATGRGWDVSGPGDEGIVMTLVHRDFESELTFEYGDGWIKIYSLSYKIDKDTLQRIKRAEPEGWIRNLHKDILTILGLFPTSQ